MYGFSLMEVMITVAIIGIVSSIALPVYTEHVTKSHRKDATDETYRILKMQESYFLENQSYARRLDSAEGGLGFTNNWTWSSANRYYWLRIIGARPLGCAGTSATPCTEFAVQATPWGTQTSDIECGNYWTMSSGLRWVHSNGRWINNRTNLDRIKKCW